MNAGTKTAPSGAACAAVSCAPVSLKQCVGCGCVYTADEFLALPTFQEWRIAGDWLGYAQCSGCFSSITVRLGDDTGVVS